METIELQAAKTPSVPKSFWIGRIISGICILFLLTDAIMKLFMNHYHVEGTQQLGWDASAVQPIGFILLVCTVLYIIPKTSLIGLILLTGYMGGAIAIMARIGQPFFFPLIFILLLWTGLALRNDKVKKVLL
jgi:hypothetical protein